MSEITYGVFINESSVLCIKNAMGCWEFPYTTEPTVYGDYDPFKKIILSEYINNPGVFGIENMVFFFSTTKDIILASPKEHKWINKNELKKLNWSPCLSKQVKTIESMFVERKYVITEKNLDGTEEIMWSGICSDFEWQKQFYRLIKEQEKVFHSPHNAKPWRQIRAYNESGELIRTES